MNVNFKLIHDKAAQIEKILRRFHQNVLFLEISW